MAAVVVATRNMYTVSQHRMMVHAYICLEPSVGISATPTGTIRDFETYSVARFIGFSVRHV